MRILIALCCSICVLFAEAQRLPRFTLKKTDQNIFGTYVLYDRIQDFFPYAKLETNHKSVNEFLRYNNSKNTALVFITPSFELQKEEISRLDDFLERGNVIVISSYYIDDAVQKWLDVTVTPNLFMSTQYDFKKDSVSFWNSDTYDYNRFPTGRAMSSTVKYKDSTVEEDVLGYNNEEDINCVLIEKNGGYVMLQTQPYMFTNFHLLNKKTKAYTELFFSSMPGPVYNIIWDEYSKGSGKGEDSPLKFVMKNPALRAAFWWGIAALLLLVFMGFKRRQKAIKTVEPITNTTVDMVRTISDLYFYSHSNKVMAKKKIAHWLEHLRTNYNINQGQGMEVFWNDVKKRSVLNETDFITLQKFVTRYRNGDVSPSDNDLIQLTILLDSFYKI